MKREEAIRWLEDIHRRFNPTGENLENEGGDVHLQALDMAIDALSEPTGDLISRQDAIDALMNDSDWADAIPTIKSLPSADRPTGKWVEYGMNTDGTHNIKCNQCGAGFRTRGHANSHNTKERFKWCPTCGADMRGEQNG